ncbi:MAG: hypothetical protein ACR2QK_11685 [Acidimicrobiales bacterium]
MNRTSASSGPVGRPRFGVAKVVVILVALLALAGACGNGDDLEAEQPTENGAAEDASADLPASDHTLTESHPELISAEKAAIDSVAAIDDRTLAVRYQNGSEPCSLANVTVTETEGSITVLLETGLHPNAAAMSCIAQVIDYEIRVELADPVGDREIVIDNL